jgi:hypothetical protein
MNRREAHEDWNNGWAQMIEDGAEGSRFMVDSFTMKS